MTVTALSMKLRFPEFADLADSVVQFAVEEAAHCVNDSWIAADIDRAQMLMAAHLLTLGNAAAQGFATGGQEIASETIGRISVTYRAQAAQPSGGGLPGDITTSIYGVLFLKMCKANFPAARIV